MSGDENGANAVKGLTQSLDSSFTTASLFVNSCSCLSSPVCNTTTLAINWSINTLIHFDTRFSSRDSNEGSIPRKSGGASRISATSYSFPDNILRRDQVRLEMQSHHKSLVNILVALSWVLSAGLDIPKIYAAFWSRAKPPWLGFSLFRDIGRQNCPLCVAFQASQSKNIHTDA